MSPVVLGVLDGNQLMPFVLLGGLWLVILWRIVHGLRTGRLTTFRSESTFESDRPTQDVERSRTPRRFWLLFAFYVVVLVIIPMLMFAAARRRNADAAPSTPAGSPEANPD